MDFPRDYLQRSLSLDHDSQDHGQGLLTYRWPITYDRAKSLTKPRLLVLLSLLQCVAPFTGWLRCPDKYWAQAADHTSYGAQPMPQPSCPQNLPLMTCCLTIMDQLWCFSSISAHWGSHANCISGLPVQPKDPHGSHSLHSAGYIHYTEFFLAKAGARLWEPTPGDSQCSLEAILWLFYFTIQTPIEPSFMILEKMRRKVENTFVEQGFCRLNLSLSKPKLTAQLSEAERHQCQDTQPG